MSMLKQGKNILLLIPNQRTSALTAKLLSVHGFTCTSANSFSQALTIVGNGDVQVALVDFGVEPDDGCRFARVVKNLAAGLPVVICDAAPTVARAQRVRDSGAFDYLCCPFVVPDLVNCIRRATAVLSTARKPFVVLDAYLAANGVKSEPAVAAQPAASASGIRPLMSAAASVVKSSASLAAVSAAVRDDLLRCERELLAALRTRGILDEDLETKAAEKLAKEGESPSGTLSAMAALELVSEDAWERAAEWVASDSKAPPVDFGTFPPDEKRVRAVNAAVLRRYLAVPFAKLDVVTFVAMPYPHEAARTAVAKAVGGECRFFTCSGLAAKAVLERAFAPKKEAAKA